MLWTATVVVAGAAAAFATLRLAAVTFDLVLVVAAIEGVLAGVGQVIVLRLSASSLAARWLVPTLAGTLLGRAFEYAVDTSSLAGRIEHWPVAAHWVLGALFGAALGAIMAVPQIAALGWSERAGRWLGARALAWALALPLLLIIGSLWSRFGTAPFLWPATALVFLLMLVIVGAIEGFAMSRVQHGREDGD